MAFLTNMARPPTPLKIEKVEIEREKVKPNGHQLEESRLGRVVF
jgi:hypothetical protein